MCKYFWWRKTHFTLSETNQTIRLPCLENWMKIHCSAPPDFLLLHTTLSQTDNKWQVSIITFYSYLNNYLKKEWNKIWNKWCLAWFSASLFSLKYKNRRGETEGKKSGKACLNVLCSSSMCCAMFHCLHETDNAFSSALVWEHRTSASLNCKPGNPFPLRFCVLSSGRD